MTDTFDNTLRRVLIYSSDPAAEQPVYAPSGELLTDNRLVEPAPPEPQGPVSQVMNRLMGLQFGEPRLQLWPEKMVRSGATLAGDVATGKLPLQPPGLRREDFTDVPVDEDKIGGTPHDDLIQRVQDMAGLAMTGGLAGTGAGGKVLGSGPTMPKRPVEVENVNGTRRIPMSPYNQDMETAGILFDQAAKAKRDLGKGKPEVVTVDPRELLSTQNTFEEGVGGGGGFKGMNDKPLVVRTPDGEMHIIDGHHRLEAAAEKGKKLPAYVLDVAGHPELYAKNEAAAPLAALEKRAPPWFSPVEHALEQTTNARATGAQWLATLRNSRGVKPEELDWTGLNDYLTSRADQVVSRPELHEYLRDHRVELQDVTKKAVQEEHPDFNRLVDEKMREHPNWMRSRAEDDVYADLQGPGGEPKYVDYQLPGGENYREHLITLPAKRHLDGRKPDQYDPSQQGLGNYYSPHWDEPNIVAHVRSNVREMDGKKSLHLEEVQSDWHQAGRRKGYKGKPPDTKGMTAEEVEHYGQPYWRVRDKNGNIYSNIPRDSQERGTIKTSQEAVEAAVKYQHAAENSSAVPDAPWKKTWHELALKRMIRVAAEEGMDRVSWTPGEAQAARYDLSKQIQKISYNKDAHTLQAFDHNNKIVMNSRTTPDKLADSIGKEAADKLINNPSKKRKDRYGNWNILEDLDLKVGGEGMHGFYDKMMVQAAEKIGREYGVKVRRVDISGDKPSWRLKQLGDGNWIAVDPHGNVMNKNGIEFQWTDRSVAERKVSEANSKSSTQPIWYFDIPPAMREAALGRGMPLFSGGKMFVPSGAQEKRSEE